MVEEPEIDFDSEADRDYASLVGAVKIATSNFTGYADVDFPAVLLRIHLFAMSTSMAFGSTNAKLPL